MSKEEIDKFEKKYKLYSNFWRNNWDESKAKEYKAKSNQRQRNIRANLSEEARNIFLLNRRIKHSKNMENLTYKIHRRIKAAERYAAKKKSIKQMFKN